MIEQELGHYKILERIGAGGMGEVYRAHDSRLDRDVALKILAADRVADETVRKRLHKEARTLSRLSHPNIATVHDFDTQGGVDFLVMELIPGEGLEEKLRSGPLPEKEVLRLGAQLARGLSAAHEHGVIHRDLKPGNLRLTGDGMLKILDFGLAVTQDAATGSAWTTDSAEQPFAGTLPYMAPEQIQGHAADARTDIYGAGNVLYEMATGRRPFAEVHGPLIPDAILHQPPPSPRQIQSQISSGLEFVITKALEKDPDRRYQSAKDLLLDLERLATPSAATASPVLEKSPPHSWTVVLAGAILLLAVIAGGGLWWKSRGTKPVVLDSKRIVVAVFENRTGDPSLDPLGRQAAESIIDNFSKVKTVNVLPAPTVLPASAGGADAASKRDPVHALAESTGAGVVVSGAYYLEGPTLQIQAKVTDLTTAKLLWTIDPASAAKEKAAEAVETIRQRLLDVVAARYLAEGFDMLASESRPPRYEAQVEYIKGDNLRHSDASSALAHYRSAIELDPGFLLPRLHAATTLNNMGRFADADAELDRLEAMKDRMTPAFRRDFDYHRASIAGRWEEDYWITVENYARSPERYRVAACRGCVRDKPSASRSCSYAEAAQLGGQAHGIQSLRSPRLHLDDRRASPARPA